jgi:hypothetical protein
MYEANASTLATALSGSNPTVFTSSTLAQIISLSTGDGSTAQIEQAQVSPSGAVTVPAGAEVAFISDTIHTTITPPANVPVVVFQGTFGVHAVFNDGGSGSGGAFGVPVRMVVASGGNDNLVGGDSKNTMFVLGAGDSTVVSGSGHDTIVAGTGNSTISSAGGFDVVEINGKASDYTVTVQHGHALVHDNVSGENLDITGIQYVQVDGGGAFIFAKNAQEAGIATLYETTFGRTAEAGGLQYWFDQAAHGASMSQVAQGFASSAEFQHNVAALSDQQFVANLYQNTFGRAADDGGAAYWAQVLHNGATRAQLIEAFANIAGQNLSGDAHTEVHIVGHVTVIPNII